MCWCSKRWFQILLTAVFVCGFAAPAASGDLVDHVEAQLEALVLDRPDLAASLRSRPELRVWIEEQFRGDPPLFWSSDAPHSGRAAEFDARDPESYFVRVDAGPSGIDQLANLIFELNNAIGASAFDAIHERAVRGEIDREEYATAMLGQEMRSLEGARSVYREHLADLSARERREAQMYYRLLHGPGDVEGRIAMYLERGFDLRDHFRALYDEYVVPEAQQQ